MMNAIGNVINQIDSLVWGWWMIILLLGTHIFMTIRTGVIQRKIGTAIRLSVTKDPDAEGEVSQFGALTTALASTIGTGNIIGVGTAIALGGPGAVLWCWLTGVFRNRHQIQRISDCRKIPCKNQRRPYAGWCHVCSGAWTEYEMAGSDLCILRRLCFLWNRLCHTGQCHCNGMQ